MAHDELERLSRDEPLELLARQTGVIGRQQEELAEREAAIERRDEKIRELEGGLAQFRRPAKTPENSSVPPSRGQQANRVAGRRRKLGPKRGHVGISRVRSEPDVVVACRPRACAGCGEALPQTGGQQVGRSQVTDLPVFAEWAPRLLTRIEQLQPRIAAFHGVTAVRAFARYALGEPKPMHGLGAQDRRIGDSRLFVVPNPSPANAHFRPADQTAWYDGLADFLNAVGPARR